jgi:regulator of protease activity HflC (stomatin/prohibitin superfamily)
MRATGNTNSSSNAVSLTVTGILLAASAGLFYLKVTGVPVLVIMVIISLLIGSSIKIADQWEKAVVLRMGKFSGLKGPGLPVTVLDPVRG